MKLGAAAKILTAAAVWRSTGLSSAGRTLIKGLAADDETVRTMAGIFLVRAGHRSEPLLRDALGSAAPAQVPMLLRVLGDLGSPTANQDFESYTHSDDPEIAQAAADAIRAAEFARRKSTSG